MKKLMLSMTAAVAVAVKKLTAGVQPGDDFRLQMLVKLTQQQSARGDLRRFPAAVSCVADFWLAMEQKMW